MTEIQRMFICELLTLSYKHGFDASWPLNPIAEKLGITDVLYDNNTESGVLWDIGQKNKGYLRISKSENDNILFGIINFDLRDYLELRCDYENYISPTVCYNTFKER